MAGPNTDNIPDYYKPYVSLLGTDDIITALEEGFEDVCNFFLTLPAEKVNYAYAEDKWTPKQILQHIIDVERILSQRALRFARQDMTQLPGFDHENYVAVCDVSGRKMSDMVEEYKSLRRSIQLFYKGLTEKDLKREGFANGMVLSVENQGFVLAGHVKHHHNVIIERYLT